MKLHLICRQMDVKPAVGLQSLFLPEIILFDVKFISEFGKWILASFLDSLLSLPHVLYDPIDLSWSKRPHLRR